MIKDLAELKRLLSLCRKQGVKDIKLGDISITFGDAPSRKDEHDEGDDDIQTDELSPEQLMFLSVGGPPA